MLVIYIMKERIKNQYIKTIFQINQFNNMIYIKKIIIYFKILTYNKNLKNLLKIKMNKVNFYQKIMQFKKIIFIILMIYIRHKSNILIKTK